MNNDTSDLLTLKASNTNVGKNSWLSIYWFFFGHPIETKDSKTNDLFVMLLYSLKLNPKLILNLREFKINMREFRYVINFSVKTKNLSMCLQGMVIMLQECIKVENVWGLFPQWKLILESIIPTVRKTTAFVACEEANHKLFKSTECISYWKA